MPPIAATPAKRSFELSDAYYILFRHKWKILICLLVGLISSGAVYRFSKPPYRSVAKLFVRFVITEGKDIGPNNDDRSAKSPDQRGETIMTGEKEIITSADLARRVVEAVGAEKILAKAGGGKDAVRATGVVMRNLNVVVPPRSSVIHVSFQHPDPEVVQPVLREVIEAYLKMHFETHRAAGVLSDSLVQETDQLRTQLNQTEENLRKKRLEAGVVSVVSAKQAFADQTNKIREQIFAVRAELAAQTAILEEYNKRNPDKPKLVVPKAEDIATLPPEKISEFRAVSARLANLQANEQALLGQFTENSPRVKEIRQQIADAETARLNLVTAYPGLIQSAAPPAAQAAPAANAAVSQEVSAFGVVMQIAALSARIKELNNQLEVVRAESAKVDQLEGAIEDLTRKKELDEANYRYLAATLEQSRIRETLGNGHISNINAIQSPSAPFPDPTVIYKIAGGLAGGGLIIGLGWAILIELFFDRSLRRPRDVERQLSIPLFLTIPIFKSKDKEAKKKKKASAAPAETPPSETGVVPAAADNPIETAAARVFHETLRDRLIGYFESKGLTHKPKLVAVTGVSGKSGVTSIAAGLARSLSETGDGNVLLVDFTNTHGSSQHFTNGRPQCELDELLAARDNALVESNLYVVNEGKNSEQLSRQLPQRFTKIVPKLKASDFDYIIFDMPTVNQISITPRLANFMDMVLLVVESEKTNQDVAQRAVALLRNSKTHLGVVMNKTRNYIPGAADHDLISA